jgi:hypothetical protein
MYMTGYSYNCRKDRTMNLKNVIVLSSSVVVVVAAAAAAKP